MYQNIMIANAFQKPRKHRPKLENTKRMEKKKTKRETLQASRIIIISFSKTIFRYRLKYSRFQVSRATIDLTSDAMTDASSGEESYEGLSPVRRVHKLLQSSAKLKPRRKKKMPPELKIIPAAQVVLLKPNNNSKLL